MQATFGPTREGLTEMGQTTPAEWIRKQMSLPVGSHREHYRKRANPFTDGPCPVGKPRPPCRKGSRWHNFAFTLADVGHSITGNKATVSIEKLVRTEVGGSEWRIEKTVRTEVGDSAWRKSFKGAICFVNETLGGQVLVAQGGDCRATRRTDMMYFPNSPIHLSSAVPVRWAVDSVKPGVVVLAEEVGACPKEILAADSRGEDAFIKDAQGKVYHHQTRLELFDNTFSSPRLLPEGTLEGCAPKTLFNEQTCRPAARPSEDCPAVCGSPFEVANDPAEGHHHSFYFSLNRTIHDLNWDSRYAGNVAGGPTKSVVWIHQAMFAKDQLRQRVAWALSQIIVASTEEDINSENWMVFYDIFVRHSFGSYLDILREVTYSPIMGHFLTHTGSESWDYSGRSPNENYARELMQLFSIGLEKLNPDGSVQVDADGKPVPTYGTQEILSFSRALSGFILRGRRNNVEHFPKRGIVDAVDPLRINVKRHDIYPKPDLYGGYLGDGYPLCSDPLPTTAFLAKGAKYEYLGKDGPSNALELRSGSKLLQALCGPKGQCPGFFVVELREQLACSGDECKAGAVTAVKAGGVYYRFMPPPCVDLYFSTLATVAAGAAEPTAQPGSCLNADGRPIGLRRAFTLMSGSAQKQRECLEKCRQAGATACELVWGSSSKKENGCWAHFVEVSGGKGDKGRVCWNLAAARKNVSRAYAMLPKKISECPSGTAVESYAECLHAFNSLGLDAGARKPFKNDDVPTGCSYSKRSGMSWSILTKSKDSFDSSYVICRSHATVGGDGEFTVLNGETTFEVSWLKGAPPPPGLHLAGGRAPSAVFDRIPTRAEAEARLRVGAHQPDMGCSICDGEVRAYFTAGSTAVDVNTVFEVGGRLLRNVEYLAEVGDGGHLMRNPPVFLRSVNDEDAERKVEAEVDSLLDHLFRHSNTPTFVGRRLIQRLVTSNPSPGYLKAVTDAFRTGAYGGVVYSGEYGDLGATVAAILLHPEARLPPTSQTLNVSGALREPFLKFIHLMRSMEYQDANGSPIIMTDLQKIIGQFPYSSPTVFNFYLPDFALPGGMEMEPEPEPEPEPMPRVSPELQILTPPYMVGYLNMMSTLVTAGVSSKACGLKDKRDKVMGRSIGRTVKWFNDKRKQENVCPQGSLTWPGGASKNETLEELDLLLTGGRLTPVAKGAVQTAYERAPKGSQLSAAQHAITMTAEFNTLGSPVPLPGTRKQEPPSPPRKVRPYRAVVMLFLEGGADTFNMIVPQECSLYNDYRKARTNQALDPSQLLRISTSGQACKKFGIHARLSALKDLYDKGEAAFLSNIGNLPEPSPKAALKKGKVRRCVALFSHHDQITGAQTLKCQDKGTNVRGVGGRMADELAAGPHKYRTESFSLAGTSTWPQGLHTKSEIVSSTPDVFLQSAIWNDTISSITSQLHGNVYSDQYAQALRDSIDETERMKQLMDSVKLKTKDAGGGQFEQVAKLIAARKQRNAERDFFFLRIRGWDMHTDLKENLDNHFKKVNDALEDFVAEMRAQRIWDSVVFATESEFGRTLNSNGRGTDHGWAGNHIVVGGGVKGGRIFNKFASLAPNSEQDLGRGRIIPEYPWENMLVPIAEWMGLNSKQVANVFPNIGNFNSTHILARDALFKS